MTLAPNHRQDLEKSGLSEETIEKAGIKSVPPGSISKALGYNNINIESAYLIPYPGTDGHARLRLFYQDGKTGNKYSQKKGSPNRLYFPDPSNPFRGDPAIPLYIVEGEKKALKGAQEGLPCIGLPGLWNWSNGKGELIHDFGLLHLQGRTVYIVPDNDWRTPKAHGYKGKGRNLEEAVRRLAEKLMEKGAKVGIVLLPEGPLKGLDDYLLHHSIEDFRVLPVITLPSSTGDILERLESWEYVRGCEVKIEWIVDRLIPRGAIIILFGKGGIGKTWVAMDFGRCIADGLPYLGLQTIQSPVVFIDFENPLAVLNERTRKLGECRNVYFWRANNPKLTAPRLDSKEWDLYKKLPEGAVLIFDTLRASQGRDENASNEMGLIMGRLKELRDLGFTVILLHHTSKNNDRVAKGSTAIVDLADHILGLTLVRKKTDGSEVILDDDDDEEGAVYRFGWREKTRFEPYALYLTLDPDRGFDLAPDPDEEALKAMHGVLGDREMIKTAFVTTCISEVGLSKGKASKLFSRGIGRYWTTKPQGKNNAILVTPIRFSGFPPLYSTGKPENRNPVCQGGADGSEAEKPENSGFAGLPTPFRKTGKPEKSGLTLASMMETSRQTARTLEVEIFEEVVST